MLSGLFGVDAWKIGDFCPGSRILDLDFFHPGSRGKQSTGSGSATLLLHRCNDFILTKFAEKITNFECSVRLQNFAAPNYHGVRFPIFIKKTVI
jgi:hypothetical protein